jgi:rhamnosyltransferase
MSDKHDGVEVSVVLLSKNPGQIFKEVLDAVFAQEAPWLFEVIVIDSGSTDGTIELLKNYPKLRVIQIPSHEFGHGKTRNLGVSIAKGAFIAMLTHDAKPSSKEWLVNLVAPLRLDSQVAGVFGRHIAYDSASTYTKRDLQLHFDGFLQWPAVMGIEDQQRYEHDQGYRQLLHFFSDNNACLRKAVWESIPYPDVDFAEDQLWAKTVIESGFKRAYADEAVVFHSHDYSVRDTFRRSFDESRALRRLFGYILCPSFFHACLQTAACTQRDWRYLSSKRLVTNELLLALNTPFLHLARQLGFLAGAYTGSREQSLFSMLSLDRSKKAA